MHQLNEIGKTKTIDLAGKTFGKLTVLEKSVKSGKNTSWLCRCVCGVEKSILAYNLTSGKSRSCGCVRGAKLGGLVRTHSGSGTRLYSIYKGMKQRCGNPKNPAYKYYGGKGICLCDEWVEGFDAFREWAISNGYSEGLSIDRIDPNGWYSPENCRWVTMHQQQNNKINSMFIVVGKDKLTIAEWADRTKTNKQTLYDKIYRLVAQLGLENKEIKSFEIKLIEGDSK